MGMTIDDNIDFLNEAKKFYEEIANTPSLNETLKTYFTIESLESAINIMHKYQKIEEIIQHWIDADLACESPSFADSGTIEDIIEVIKDGNDS